jgi:hypothetical protein
LSFALALYSVAKTGCPQAPNTHPRGVNESVGSKKQFLVGRKTNTGIRDSGIEEDFGD